MKRLILTTSFALGTMLFLQAGAVRAQGKGGGATPGGINQPAVSPYLGLLNRNNSPAFNYFTNVLPRQQAQDAFNRQDQINQDVYNQDTSQGSLTTGHRTAFLNHQRYFMTTTQGLAAGRPGGTGVATGQRPPGQQQQPGGAYSGQ